MERYATASAIGQSVEGASSRPSLHSAIVHAADLGKQLSQHGEILAGMVERAESLAIKLGGSYPSNAGAKDPSAEGISRDPVSSIDAINTAIGELFDRSNAFNPRLERLERALNAIDRAIG